MTGRAMTTDPDVYFARGCGRCDRFGTPDCATRIWAGPLAALRRICRAAGLEETAKWGHPVYVHAGRNIAILGAVRGDVRLSFMDAALLHDPEGHLDPAGPNSRIAGMLRFDGAAQVAAREGIIAEFLAQAKAHAEAGIRPARKEVEVALPDALVAALEEDPDLAEAFHNLTPGRQRSYVLMVEGAKQDATKAARIARARGRILAGKGAQER